MVKAYQVIQFSRYIFDINHIGTVAYPIRPRLCNASVSKLTNIPITFTHAFNKVIFFSTYR